MRTIKLKLKTCIFKKLFEKKIIRFLTLEIFYKLTCSLLYICTCIILRCLISQLFGWALIEFQRYNLNLFVYMYCINQCVTLK